MSENRKRYGRLVMLGDDPAKHRRRKVICQCDCGALKIVYFAHLQSGNTRSCGCLRKEVTGAKNRVVVGGVNSATHNLHATWKNMKARCYNAGSDDFPQYGGRGISVCKRWRESFTKFAYDMGTRPEGYTLDRRDNSKGYSPENCRWATPKEQCANTRRNRWITFKGETLTLGQWEEKLGFKTGSLKGRLRIGWSVEKALTTPIRKQRPHAI